MSEVDFVETYLREIGVQTPVSLVCLGNNEHRAKPVSQQAVENVAMEKPDLKSIPVNEMDLAMMAEEARQCQRCGLAKARQHVVFGQGNPHADLVFIGDAVNSSEDKIGKSLIGHAGEMFESMLMAMGLHREQVYYLNILQCMPPNHRDPKLDELDACSIWLDGQLDKVSPKMICVLGRGAAQALLRTDAVLHDLRGEWHRYQGIPVWISYDPAYLLRSPQAKKQVWGDLLIMRERLLDL